MLIIPLTSEQLSDLVQKAVRKVICETSQAPTPPESDQLLTIKQAAEILNLSVSTLYGLVNRKQVPVYKRSKRLYFSKQELLDWIKAGRKTTNAEINAEAEAFVNHLNERVGRRAA